jgi:diadenosine tetraphosphate (Ap4A) HIT family hydrolase
MEEECKICQMVTDKSNPLRISELDVSVVGLNPNQLFRGYTFVTYKGHVTELYHLSLDERMRFCGEMIRVAKALDEVLHPDKMNYELLGNTSAHMHWHLIPRYKNDGFWGRPIWVRRHEEKRLKEEEYRELIKTIREHL